MTDARAERIAAIVGAVARQCLADRGAHRVALLDDGSPEAELAARILVGALGEDAVVRVRAGEADLEPLLHLGAPRARTADEARRLRARLLEGAVAAHPAHKTELLLGPSHPPDPLLPLGDLYASEVAELAGGWSASDEVRALAEAAGGVEALDVALRRRVEGRDPSALDALPEARRRFEAGRAARLMPRIVPKLGTCTLGADLLE